MQISFEESEEGIAMVMRSIGLRNIQHIILEFIQYPPNEEFLGIFNSTLEILNILSSSRDRSYIETLLPNY